MLRCVAIVAMASSLSCSSGSHASCTAVAPCGGNLVGTWKLQDSCSSSTSTVSCGTNHTAFSENLNGTITFNSDMTYALSSGGDETITLTIPLSCFTNTGTTTDLACTGVRSGPSSLPGPGTCTVSGSNCDCHMDEPLPNVTESGTYGLSGSMITTTPSNGDGTNSTVGYCVSGDTLSIGGAAVVGVSGEQITATRQ
jgi:hypothetical protein